MLNRLDTAAAKPRSPWDGWTAMTGRGCSARPYPGRRRNLPRRLPPQIDCADDAPEEFRPDYRLLGTEKEAVSPKNRHVFVRRLCIEPSQVVPATRLGKLGLVRCRQRGLPAQRLLLLLQHDRPSARSWLPTRAAIRWSLVFPTTSPRGPTGSGLRLVHWGIGAVRRRKVPGNR